MWKLGVAVLLACFAPACSTYRDDLVRSQHAFEENQHETALAILRMLEPDQGRLDPAEQAHYAYLRGMTDYRIGYKADARHWLVLAKAMDVQTPGLLPEPWRTRLDRSLSELDAVVWASGMDALSAAGASDRARAKAIKRRAPKKPEPGARETDEADEEEEEQKPPPPKKKPVDDEDE